MALRTDLEYKSLSDDNTIEVGIKKNSISTEKKIVIYAKDILFELETYQADKKKLQSPTPEINKVKIFYDAIKNKDGELSGEELSDLVKILVETTPKEKSPKTLKVYETLKGKFPPAFLDNMRNLQGWNFPAKYFKYSEAQCVDLSKAYLEICHVYDFSLKKVLQEAINKQPDKSIHIMKDYNKLASLRDFPRSLIMIIMAQWSPSIVKAFEILSAAEIRHESYQKFILNHSNKCIELAQIFSFLKEACMIDVPTIVPGVLNFIWQHVNKIDQDLVKRIEEMKSKRTLNFENLKTAFLGPVFQMNLGNFGMFKSADEKEAEATEAVHKTFSLV